MKARLKTVGVEEYHFVMENCPPHFTTTRTSLPNPSPSVAPKGSGDWYIYDVGGSRCLVSPITSVQFLPPSYIRSPRSFLNFFPVEQIQIIALTRMGLRLLL